MNNCADAKSMQASIDVTSIYRTDEDCEQSADNRLAEISVQLFELRELTQAIANMARKHGDMLLGSRPEANSSGVATPPCTGFVDETIEQIREIRGIAKDAHSNLSRYA